MNADWWGSYTSRWHWKDESKNGLTMVTTCLVGMGPGEFSNLWETPEARDGPEAMLVTMVNGMAQTVDPIPVSKSEG